MNETSWWLFGFIVVLTVLHFWSRSYVYRSGVWDGAYCQFLPQVRAIMDEYHNAGSVKACQRETAEARPDGQQVDLALQGLTRAIEGVRTCRDRLDQEDCWWDLIDAEADLRAALRK